MMPWSSRLLVLALLMLGVAIGHDVVPARAEVIDRFDHYSTGFPLDGRHVLLDCAACHVNGVFKGTPRSCDNCHDNVFAEGKSFRHIPTARPCVSCHTTQEWRLSRFDHTDVTADCSRCHNNFLAPGKTASHPPTSNVCEDCHTTVHWNILLPTYSARAVSRSAAP